MPTLNGFALLFRTNRTNRTMRSSALITVPTLVCFLLGARAFQPNKRAEHWNTRTRQKGRASPIEACSRLHALESCFFSRTDERQAPPVYHDALVAGVTAPHEWQSSSRFMFPERDRSRLDLAHRVEDDTGSIKASSYSGDRLE